RQAGKPSGRHQSKSSTGSGYIAVPSGSTAPVEEGNRRGLRQFAPGRWPVLSGSVWLGCHRTPRDAPVTWELVLLVAGGLVAGVVNTMAGGGSMLTVPLLVLAGVPGNQANGSNRIGVLTSNAAAVLSFRRSGIH